MKISVKGRWAVWAIFIFCGVTLSLITDRILCAKGFCPRISLWWRFLGLFLFALSNIIAKNTGKTLAKYGKEGKVAKFDTNRFVDKGPYSCMRHPMHFGLILLPFALALMLGSFSYLTIFAPLNAAAIIIMVFTIEEKEAIEKFGNEYIEYKKRVPAFNLSPKCLKKLFVCC